MKWRHRIQATSHRLLGLHERCGLGFPDSLIESVATKQVTGSHLLTLWGPVFGSSAREATSTIPKFVLS